MKNLDVFRAAAVAMLVAAGFGAAACSRSEGPPPAGKSAPPAVQPVPPSQQLPPMLPQRGPVARLDGFMGLSFYPGSEDAKPTATPSPDAPSVRTTPDGVGKVATFYKTRLSNTAQETRKGKAAVVEGRTPAGEVQILIEPASKGTQITMRRK